MFSVESVLLPLHWLAEMIEYGSLATAVLSRWGTKQELQQDVKSMAETELT